MKIIFVLSVLPFFWPRGHSVWECPKIPIHSRLVGPSVYIKTDNGYCGIDEPDGCSNLGIGGWKNTFTSSCNKHDMCYICGGGRHHNWSRKFCDDAFKHDMRKACEQVRKGNWLFSPRRECYHWSNIYYRAVRTAGHLAYNNCYCSQSCIKSRGDPGRRITVQRPRPRPRKKGFWFTG